MVNEKVTIIIYFLQNALEEIKDTQNNDVILEKIDTRHNKKKYPHLCLRQSSLHLYNIQNTILQSKFYNIHIALLPHSTFLNVSIFGKDSVRLFYMLGDSLVLS